MLTHERKLILEVIVGRFCGYKKELNPEFDKLPKGIAFIPHTKTNYIPRFIPNHMSKKLGFQFFIILQKTNQNSSHTGLYRAQH